MAVIQPAADGEAAIDDAALRVREAVSAGARLVVLPELYCFDGGVVPASMSADDAAHRAHVAVATLADAVHGTDALVVTSLPGELGEARSHDAVLVGADGVLARQPQLHHVERHAHWVGALGDALAVHETPFGRLALVVGDDSIYPETFRLAALGDADVVAAAVLGPRGLGDRHGPRRALGGEPARRGRGLAAGPGRREPGRATCRTTSRCGRRTGRRRSRA